VHNPQLEEGALFGRPSTEAGSKLASALSLSSARIHMTPQDLVALRKSMDLGQTLMAETIGMSLRAYQALESGDSPIRTLHILAMERAAEKVAIATKDPTVAPLTVRRDAQELVRLMTHGNVETSNSQFKLVEIELDRHDIDRVASRNVSREPFSTRAEAEAAAQQAAESLWASGFNDEHGYWWARDMRGVNYRFYVEPY
jgi:DNA-binding XRE family transcriptional regulator